MTTSAYDKPRFKRLDKVEKTAGYRFPGVIISAPEKLNGTVLYNVEADHPDFRGMVHIFHENQLVERDDGRKLLLPIGDWPATGTVWRHTVRGTLYRVIGRGREAETCEVVVLYQAESDGTIWTRRWSDFIYGKFERVKV